jgi:hypothetical protein
MFFNKADMALNLGVWIAILLRFEPVSGTANSLLNGSDNHGSGPAVFREPRSSMDTSFSCLRLFFEAMFNTNSGDQTR